MPMSIASKSSSGRPNESEQKRANAAEVMTPLEINWSMNLTFAASALTWMSSACGGLSN